MVCKNMAKYLNRKKTIKKLAEELSTLCDVPLLLILYGPDMRNKPETWCSGPDCSSVIDKYYEKTRNKGVKFKPGNRAKKVGDDQFLEKLGLDELKALDGVLAGKIECVKQRIDGLKGGKGSGNLLESRDLDGGLTLSELGDYGKCKNLSDNMNVDSSFSEVFNPMQAVYPSFNPDYNIAYDEEFSNLMQMSSPDDFDDTELMVDISDLDNIKFVGDDLDLINRLVTVEDGAFVTELLC